MSSIFDNLMVLSYFARGMLNFTELMLGLEPNANPPMAEELAQLRLDPGVVSGRLVQIPVPIDPIHVGAAKDSSHDEVTITYSQVFDLLLVNYEAVVLGVYRAPSRGSELPYIAAPPRDETVSWTDRLFVVAPQHQAEKLLRITERYTK